MFLSVVVPTCNRNDLLSQCLELLAPSYQSVNKENYQVIVTDDSINNTARELSDEFPWATFLNGPKRGPAANRNHGARNSKGDWLIFIDDDCLPSKDLLISYYNEIEKGEWDGLEGLIAAERPRQRFDEVAPLNLNGGCFWACNIAIEKKIFNSLNGFDEGFPFAAMEDVDFFERLKKVARLKFIDSAKVIHPWRLAKPFKNLKMQIISNKYMLNKYNVDRNFNYRIKRFKLFIGILISDAGTLKKYSFKGVGLYIEKVCFQFSMLFI